jgi:hypothetical protein
VTPTTRTRLALAAALAVPLALAGASLAQPTPAPGADDGRHMMRRMDPAQMAAQHAQHLRDVLQLRPDQEGALQAFVGSMKPPEDDRDRRGDDEDRSLTTPQRLDRMLARMDEMRTRMVQHADAVKRFYAQLTPAQQKAFDALPMGGHGMMGRGRMGGGFGRHGWGRDGKGGRDGDGPPPAPGQ